MLRAIELMVPAARLEPIDSRAPEMKERTSFATLLAGPVVWLGSSVLRAYADGEEGAVAAVAVGAGAVAG